ncbi:MAG: 4-hydroxy-tetrahydrodipicolinate reductase [Sedimentisphaerales bacterium]|nr:4-hydroxy-tetrahydrodipicolinate reductase [Sedimentisphaerales bacterium]
MACKLIIHGAAGRMGRRILNLASESGDFKIVGAIDHSTHPDLGKDAGSLAGIGAIGVPLGAEMPSGGEVMIDFSLPTGVEKAIEMCLDKNIALVMGTTGLENNQREKLKKAAKQIAIIYGSNMSVGMNVLFSLVGKVAQMLGSQYDIEITETHHRHKKDSPSGTALTLAERICAQTGRIFPECLVYGRHGKEALREEGTIGVHAIRAGDITGQHSVIYGSLGETLTLSHTAHNRDNFVRGALRAALWLKGKTPGMYSMAQVLGIE